MKVIMFQIAFWNKSFPFSYTTDFMFDPLVDSEIDCGRKKHIDGPLG